MNKEKLRQKLKAKRSLLSLVEVNVKSQIIAEIFAKAVDLELVERVHVYTSVEKWKEVNTKFVALKLADKKIKFGGLTKAEPLPSKKFDLIIVPMLGFDKQLYRLGLGGGWYDRFLATQPQALKVGLAYKSAKLDYLPHEPHDVPLDMVITEGIIFKHDSNPYKN